MILNGLSVAKNCLKPGSAPLNCGLAHRVIKFNQKVWLVSYTKMDTVKQKAKNDSEEDFFKLMNNSFFGKTMENVRKHSNIKLAITEKRRDYLVSEPNYHSTNIFTGDLLTIELRRKQIIMNKPVYLGLSMLELSRIVMYKFWHGKVKLKYGEKAKL